MAQLANLPFELLRLIIAILETKTLKALSLVNKRCRAVSENEIFKTVKVSFSRKSLKMLEELAKSPLATYVKTLHYDASELLDPLIQHWEYFTSCIYTPQEYARDNAELYTSLRGKSFSYKAIYSHYKSLARDQWTIMEERADIRAMTQSLPCLLNLNTLKLSYTGSDEDQLLWFSKRLFISYEDSMCIHLEAAFMGMAKAQQKGLLVRSVEVESMHSMLPSYHPKITKIAEQGLKLVESFRLNDSPGMLSLLSSVLLPNLQIFEITDCWLVGSKLIQFLEGHSMELRSVRFCRISLFYEKFREDGRFSENLMDFWKTISDTGNTGKIESLTIVRTP